MYAHMIRLVASLIVVLASCLPADAALVTSYSATGNLGVSVSAYPTSFTAGPGTLTVSGLPAGASIVQAYLYANNYFGTPATSATFNGNPLGPVGALATDGGATSYRFDVTSLVTGNGSYSANYSGPTNTYGLALAVVYSHPSLPFSQVFINDGAFDIGDAGAETVSTTFAGVTSAGAGNLWVHTWADNLQGQTNEEIRFNGNVVGGPIDANLGDFASLFSLPVTAVVGNNTASIFSPADQFGWELAVLRVPAVAPQAIPEPTLIGVFACCAIAAGLRARRRTTPTSA